MKKNYPMVRISENTERFKQRRLSSKNVQSTVDIFQQSSCYFLMKLNMQFIPFLSRPAAAHRVTKLATPPAENSAAHMFIHAVYSR